jgi:RNA-dependent RNA polymerase
MLGARCVYGEDKGRMGREGYKPGFGLSYLAFDFRREQIHIKAKLFIDDTHLPPALRPLDAELSFEDIANQGVHIVYKPVPPLDLKPGRGKESEVTVTITCRRPPRFYTAFEARDEMFQSGRGDRVPYRRRATAMDFATTGQVRGENPYDLLH